MKKLVFLTGSVFLACVSNAWAWTLYYDGFAYGPVSDGSPAFLLGTQIGYELGDPHRHRTQPIPNWSDDCAAAEPASWCNFQPTICDQYDPSPWAAANNNGQWGAPGSGISGYWPYIINYNLNPPAPMPAATGNAVICNGTASNNGKVARVSPINLNQSPPTGPFRTISRGKLYYSMMVWVPESATTPTPGNGNFHAGFNNQPPEACLCYNNANACTLQTAAARLLLRRAAGDGSTQAFNIGIQSHAAAGITSVWDPTIYPGGPDPATAIFVVASYEFRNNWGDTPNLTDDVSRLWVNPNPATFGDSSQEPAPTVESTGGDIPELQIQSFFLREGQSAGTAGTLPVARAAFDELRIGTSWADVTSDVACTPPTVTAISPEDGLRGTTTTATITGTNFVQGVTQVRLRTTGEPDIAGNNVDVTDPQHLTVNFNIPAGAALGLRDVVVITCPDSTATLAGAFEVVSCRDPIFDADNDSDVDLNDFGRFQVCFGNPASTLGCSCFDKDASGTIDGPDFVSFMDCGTRDQLPANPACDD
jgi:hypothetical protein